jgi:hypothetical protein
MTQTNLLLLALEQAERITKAVHPERAGERSGSLLGRAGIGLRMLAESDIWRQRD